MKELISKLSDYPMIKREFSDILSEIDIKLSRQKRKEFSRFSKKMRLDLKHKKDVLFLLNYLAKQTHILHTGDYRKRMSKALYIRHIEYNFVKNGKNYIKINKLAYDIINNINISNVDLSYIVNPFNACCWIIDNKKYYSSAIPPNINVLDLHLKHDFSCLFDTGEGFELGSSNTKDLKEQLEFIIKACVFIQAYPHALKEGQYPNDEIVLLSKGNKKTYTFNPPSEFTSPKSAHYCRPHFRTLSHSRFARQDKEGNILPIGKEGIVRVVMVKGHFKGGKLHHVQ